MTDKPKDRKPCRGFERHWFSYRAEVGTSAPVCQRAGCDEPNPNYRPDDDPRAEVKR